MNSIDLTTVQERNNGNSLSEYQKAIYSNGKRTKVGDIILWQI